MPPIIHGNIKPQNILIGQNNGLLLSDFGSVLHSQQGSIPQTLPLPSVALAYAAPEQLASPGNPDRVSAAVDQYALGVLVYDLLTNACPFHGDEQAMRTQKLNAAPSLLRTNRPDITPEVERVVLKALARDGHNRYASVRDFATALEQANKIHHDE